jgi:hypothetical protein
MATTETKTVTTPPAAARWIENAAWWPGRLGQLHPHRAYRGVDETADWLDGEGAGIGRLDIPEQTEQQQGEGIELSELAGLCAVRFDRLGRTMGVVVKMGILW